MLALDIIMGNPDRHLGNYVYDERGHLWAIDHGHATWLRFGAGALGFRPLSDNYPLMFYLGRDAPPEESMQHGNIQFPPQLVARWSRITREEFMGAFAGVSEEGRVKLENGWRNLQYIVERQGHIVW